MDINSVSNTLTTAAAQSIAAAKKTTEAPEQKAPASDTGVIYEKNQEASDQNVTRNKSNPAIVAKMKADAEQRTSQLRSLVEKMMTQQGAAIGKADSMWSFLADGNFTVDAATKAQAQADIAEDGYWGVEQTSDRILDFAKALSGNDPEKADLLLDAFKKGFEEATGSWGKKLPDISQRTYDAVVDKFEQWKNGDNADSAANA